MGATPLNDWAAAIQDAIQLLEDVVPPGWKTTLQIMAETGQGRKTVMRAIKAMLKNGQAEARKFKLRNKRTVTPVVHYRLK